MARQYAVPGSLLAGFLNETGIGTEALGGTFVNETSPINTSVAPGAGSIVLTGFAPSTLIATNGFASAPCTSTGTGNAGANSIFLTKVTLINAATVSAVLLNTPNATSSISFKAVIYDGSHSALLGTGSTVTSVASGYNRFALTSPLSLSAGTYYVGYACANSCNVTIDATQTGNNWFVSGGQSVSSPANPLSGGVVNSSGLMVALELAGAASVYGFAPDFTGGVTLSAANTVATSDAARTEAVRSVVTHAADVGGKFYAEVLISGTINTTTAVGLLAASSTMSAPTATNKFAEMLTSNGLASGTTSAAPGITYVSGDVIGIAYDATTGTVWFNKNNGAWGGNGASPNPATGVSGVAVGAGNWPVMVAASAGTTVISFTLRDTADRQSYAPPSGFAAWSSASSGLSAAPGAGAIIVTGLAPSVGLNAAVAPGVGSIILSGFAPTINSDTVVAPSAGAIVFTGLAPAGASDAAPSTGSMSLTGFAPTPLALVGSNVFFHSVF